MTAPATTPVTAPVTGIAKIFLILLSALAVASCAPAAPPIDENPLQVGLRTTVKAFGRHYETEVTEVHGGYSVWKMRWEEQLFTAYKVYRGIFPVFGRSEDFYYHNEVDVGAIDQLFPLKVGNEVSLEGLFQNSETDGDGQLWAHIVVQGKSEINLQDSKIPVFLIDVSIERKGGKKADYWESRRLWYSPELGFSLKTEYQQGEERFTVRVLSVESPGDGDPAPRNLGTVMI